MFRITIRDIMYTCTRDERKKHVIMIQFNELILKNTDSVLFLLHHCP